MDPTLVSTPPKSNKPIEISPIITSISQAPVVPEQPKRSLLPFFMIALFFLALVSAGVAVGYFVVIVPRKAEIAYSQKLVTYLPDIRSSITKVVSSFDTIYTTITGQKRSSDGSNKLLRLNVTPFLTQLKAFQKDIKGKGMVAGASTEKNTYMSHYDTYYKFGEFFKSLDGVTQFGYYNSKVLGIQTTSDVTSQSQQVETQTGTAIQITQDATAKLNEMRSYLITKKPETLSDVTAEAIKKLQVTGDSTNQYLVEMYKTANYYHEITAVGIEMEPLMISWLELLRTLTLSSQPELSLGKVDELHSTLQGLLNRLVMLEDGSLPKGIDALHADDKKMLTLLMQNMDDIKAAIKSNSFKAFYNSVQVLSESMDPIVLRGKTLEVAFWQNNPAFKQHTALLQDLKNEEESIQKAIASAKLPPLVN